MPRIIFFIEKALLINFSVMLIFIPYSRDIAKVCFCVGLGLWLLLNIARSRRQFYRSIIPDTFLNKPIFIFLGAGVLSVLFSKDPLHSQSIFFERYIPYVFLFWMGAGLVRKDIASDKNTQDCCLANNLRILTFAFIFSSFIFGLGGAWDYIRLHPGRLWTVFGKEIIFKMFPLYLVYFIPFNFMLAVFLKGRVRFFSLVNLFLLIFCWVVQCSRMAWVAIPLSLSILTFIKSKKWVLPLFLVFIIIFAIFPEWQIKRVEALFVFKTWSLPIEFWTIAINIFRDNPLFGAGLGMFENLFLKYRDLLGNSSSGPKYLHAHSVYLETLSEMGIIGLTAFLGVFIVFFKKAFSATIDISAEYRVILLGLTGSILATFFLGLWGSIITVGTQGPPMFWFLLGMAVGLIRGEEKRGQTPFPFDKYLFSV